MAVDVDKRDEVRRVKRLVAEINATHGVHFTVRERCVGGLQNGAWLLVDEVGQRAVVKQLPTQSELDIGQVAAAVARIRRRGYPTPLWIACGSTATGASYWVQRHVAGRSATPLTAPTTKLLLRVLEGQAGLDPELARDWTSRVITMARSDEPGQPRRTVLGLGAAGHALVARYDRLLAHAPDRLPDGDLVHGDFNSCNILLRAGRIVGIIDVQDMGHGSRLVDYACLLREAYINDYGEDVTRLIRRAGDAVGGPESLALCVTAAAFFIVEFTLRHRPGALTASLTRLHQLADYLTARSPI
jgi:aminoglycoside phosphotransferase (APT) family kinase protein